MGDISTMEPSTTTGPAEDHSALLDLIDQLRSKGINRYINLPQIIVCGDQSSGKSSVLEAISGARFPVKENLCTRFPTELVLRKSTTTSAKANIRPHEHRTDGQKALLQSFNGSVEDLSKLGDLVEAAGEKMMQVTGGSFSNDILRVELTGPSMQNLTVVDLPGLFEGETKDQNETDSEFVTNMVSGYMKNDRSIILAIVSAKNDLALQKVTRLMRKIDPTHQRTLGIVTKPDTLEPGSPMEKCYRALIDNSNITLKHGWHVLKNRSHAQQDASSEDRDQLEQDFFSQGDWASLTPSRKGIQTLKLKLSRLLKDQIVLELPSLLGDVIGGIRDCEATIQRLGGPRATSAQQRNHLRRISHEFSSLLKAAVDGTYTHDFFGNPLGDVGQAKRLRAMVTNSLVGFADTMRTRGSSSDIWECPKNESKDQIMVPRSEYVDEVIDLMKRTRGRELQGTYSPMIIADLFFQQAENWNKLMNDSAAKIKSSVRMAVKMVIEHVADAETVSGILGTLIGPAVDDLEQKLEVKIKEIMTPHQRGHPITYNHYFTDNIQKAKMKNIRREVEKKLSPMFATQSNGLAYPGKSNVNLNTILDALNQHSEADMARYASLEAIDGMQAYYKVAMKTAVDNFATLCVEMCLISGLPGILRPDIIDDLSDEQVASIAAESELSQAVRLDTSTKREALEEAHKILRSYGANTFVMSITQSGAATDGEAGEVASSSGSVSGGK